jgi:transcriptional regulator with GAF, ATPase, and Fis domain
MSSRTGVVKRRCGDMTPFQSDAAIVYKSAAIRSVLTQLHQVAPTSSTMLLLVETGVGQGDLPCG